MAESLKRIEYYHGSENTLQNLVVWEFPESTAQSNSSQQTKYWLVYIHGGAWRDPRTDLEGAIPGINKLLGKEDSPLPDPQARIAGFAAINYRLSPHPNRTQDEASVPGFAKRNAKHPDHIRDVWAALSLLQNKFAFGSNYILYGHSAGATLAYQVLMGSAALKVDGKDVPGGITEPPADVALPVAVVGFEGIYDMVALNQRMGDAYRSLFAGPFGDDDERWTEASPAAFTGSYSDNWGGPSGKLAVVAHSPRDELIDMPEADLMEKRLRQEEGLCVLAYRDLDGLHDEIVEDGKYIARVLFQTLQELDKVSSTS